MGGEGREGEGEGESKTKKMQSFFFVVSVSFVLWVWGEFFFLPPCCWELVLMFDTCTAGIPLSPTHVWPVCGVALKVHEHRVWW